MAAAMRRNSSPSCRVFAVTLRTPRLFEEVGCVVQDRDVTEVDPGDGQRAAAVKRSQRNGNEIADRSEQDRRVERFRWRLPRINC